jgi:hypothetical protein
MPFVKGKSGNSKGRPEGSQNKTTVAAKEAFQMAFDHIGGWKALAEWATDPKNAGEFFKLYSKLIPQDVTTAGEKIIVTFKA